MLRPPPPPPYAGLLGEGRGAFPGHAAARWRANLVGPGGRSHVTPGTAAASQGTCPGKLYGATRRMAPPAPHQLVGAGQQLGLILFFGLGATPAGDG